jgi:Kdo2-lipid IVA lauroyltransferase/acyltransferase
MKITGITLRTNSLLATAFLRLGRWLYRMDAASRERWGVRIGTFLRRVSASRERVTYDNLRHAFPTQTEEWLQNTLRASYNNLGTTFVEVLTFPHLMPSEARAMVEFRNLHIIEEEFQKKQGLVLLSGHFGNWELMAFALPLVVDLPISVIVTEQANSFVNDLLRWYRTRTGNKLIPMDNAARTIISTLKQGEAIAMLADQAAMPETDVFVPFFGREACTYEAPAVLTLRYNASMIVGFAERLPNGTYVVELQKIKHEDLSAAKDGVRRLTLRHVAALEEIVRKHPAMWSWQHKRWKHSPPEHEA